MNENLLQVKSEITKVLRGKEDCIDQILCCMLAGGHILLEDIPGVGKTTLAVALSRAMSLHYKRMQFTPDVLPSDILGFSLLDTKTGEFVYRPGAIFTNIFLADEINRTSPKTQSALLEVMEEGSVSVDGVTRKLDAPFFVIATQNPTGASGTQKLPDSQLDRFFIRLSLGYPDHTAATEILMGHSSGNMDSVQAVLTGETLLGMQKQAEAVYTAPELIDYIVTLTEATRVHEYLLQGISPRQYRAFKNGTRLCLLHGSGLSRTGGYPCSLFKCLQPSCDPEYKGARSRTFCRRCLVTGVKNCPYPAAFPCPLI